MTQRIDTVAERAKLRAYGTGYKMRIDGDKYAAALDEIDRLREALEDCDSALSALNIPPDARPRSSARAALSRTATP